MCNKTGVVEQIIPSYVTPTIIGIRHIRFVFPHAYCMRIIKKNFRTGIEQSHSLGSNVYANAFFAVYGATPMYVFMVYVILFYTYLYTCRCISLEHVQVQFKFISSQPLIHNCIRQEQTEEKTEKKLYFDNQSNCLGKVH